MAKYLSFSLQNLTSNNKKIPKNNLKKKISKRMKPPKIIKYRQPSFFKIAQILKNKSIIFSQV